MYRKHFALTRHPFDKDLAADDLFPSASLAELTARLSARHGRLGARERHALRQRGFRELVLPAAAELLGMR